MAKRNVKRIRKTIERLGGEWNNEQEAWLGNLAGTVESGTSGVLFARLMNGDVVRVYNTIGVPSTYDLHVKIGENKHHKKIWQIIRITENYSVPAGSGLLAFHHTQHEEEGSDRLNLDRKQILTYSVRVAVAASFIVVVYGGYFPNSSGFGMTEHQLIDLSSYQPEFGAVYVAIEMDDDGVLSVNGPSDNFGAPAAGDVTFFPVPEDGKHHVALIVLFEGQAELLDSHIRVPAPVVLSPQEPSVPDDPTRYIAIYNKFLGSGAIAYTLGEATSGTGREWTIETDTVIPIGGGGSFDSYNHQFPWLIQVKGVLYLYFAGKNGSSWANFKIGVARSFDGGVTWEKYASNPVVTNAVAWENTNVFEPVVLYDREESNSAKRWKMWYAGSSFGQGIGYAYSADGLSWTKFASNPVMTLGTSGQWDDTYISPHAVIRRGNKFILFYGGKTGAMWANGIATFADPEGTYTRGANNPILSGDGIATTLTANLTAGSTTATVADATIFPIGCPVWIGYSTRFLSRVVARNSSTSIEIADEAPVTIASGQTFRSVTYNSIDIHGVFYDDGYKFPIVPHQPDGLTEAGIHEVTMWGYANDNLTQVYIDYGAGIQIPITLAESQNTNVTRENWTVVDTYDLEANRHLPALPSDMLKSVYDTDDDGIVDNSEKLAGTTPTAAGLALLDDANAAAQRTTLGLGNSATRDVGTSSAQVSIGDHTHTVFNDAEGDPADVTTGSAADGTSTYTARRDHVHHVTFVPVGQYRQFVYEVSGGDFTFIIDEDGNPVMALEDLE